MRCPRTLRKKNDLKIERTPQKTIGLLGNNRAESIGRTLVSFRFRGEEQSYIREFHVLRKSVCDVILGKSFLAETQTFTKFAHRIVERVRVAIRKCDRLFLLDESPGDGDRIRCTVNGVPAAALPDTGSDRVELVAHPHKFEAHSPPHIPAVMHVNAAVIQTSTSWL